MSKTPTKSQPLHNFSLPQLKWAHSNHRLPRRSSHEPHHLLSNPAAQHPLPPVPVPVDFNSAENTVPQSSNPANHAFRNPFSFSSLRQQENSAEDLEKNKDDGVEDIDGSKVDEFRPRKLRPRKAVSIPAGLLKSGENLLEETVARQKNENSSSGGYVAPKSRRLRGAMAVVSGQVFGQGQNHGSERQRKMTEEKSRIWISLSREEIEEDVYALTGSRPARRPKTRAKIVQRQLDHVFPGLYLVGMTVDYYRLLLSKATRAELQAINS